MNNLIILCMCFISACVLVTGRPFDETTDLTNKYNEAKSVLDEHKWKSSFVKDFVAVLSKGVEDLETKTKSALDAEKDPEKRKAILDFAVQSFDRMIAFVKEMEQNIPDGF